MRRGARPCRRPSGGLVIENLAGVERASKRGGCELDVRGLCRGVGAHHSAALEAEGGCQFALRVDDWAA